MLDQESFDSAHCDNDLVGRRTERKTDITFATGTEDTAGRDRHVSVLQQIRR
jgi:hypothetical protein